MYPFFRLAFHVVRANRMPTLDYFDTHISHHWCWPQDIDPWVELNNGRTLTLYDLGRVPLFTRTGIVALMKRHRWGGTVAGSSLRYRRRVRMWQRLEMRSRMLGWDDRFVYVAQSMWRKGECTSQALIRTAVVDANGLVPTARIAEIAGRDSPPLPAWVTAWSEAEAQRTWPPED